MNNVKELKFAIHCNKYVVTFAWNLYVCFLLGITYALVNTAMKEVIIDNSQGIILCIIYRIMSVKFYSMWTLLVLSKEALECSSFFLPLGSLLC